MVVSHGDMGHSYLRVPEKEGGNKDGSPGLFEKIIWKCYVCYQAVYNRKLVTLKDRDKMSVINLDLPFSPSLPHLGRIDLLNCTWAFSFADKLSV